MKKHILAAAAFLAFPISASATFHEIHITEVYTNADGSEQFIELQADANGQTFLSEAEIIAKDASGATTTEVIDIATNFPALDVNETVLFATPAAQTAMGFTSDYTIPAGSIPFPNGRIIYQPDGGSFIVDSVAYGAFTGTMTGFGTPAAALPTDGLHSLTRAARANNNSTDYAVAINSPKRNDGTTGVIEPPLPHPFDGWMLY